MKTNTPESQPVDEGGAAERIKVVIRAATSDDWIGVAYQKDYTGDPSTIHEYIRAPSPDSIRERAERAALRIVSGSHYCMKQKGYAECDDCTNSERRRQVVADIITAEFEK